MENGPYQRKKYEAMISELDNLKKYYQKAESFYSYDNLMPRGNVSHLTPGLRSGQTHAVDRI